MRREVRHLKQRAIDSLMLSIELFNRPHDGGRVEGVLIHADHAFEMLLKPGSTGVPSLRSAETTNQVLI